MSKRIEILKEAYRQDVREAKWLVAVNSAFLIFSRSYLDEIYEDRSGFSALINTIQVSGCFAFSFLCGIAIIFVQYRQERRLGYTFGIGDQNEQTAENLALSNAKNNTFFVSTAFVFGALSFVFGVFLVFFAM